MHSNIVQYQISRKIDQSEEDSNQLNFVFLTQHKHHLQLDLQLDLAVAPHARGVVFDSRYFSIKRLRIERAGRPVNK
jgi:hypothetical protein